MTDELKDGFNRAKEMAQSIVDNIDDNNPHLAKRKLTALKDMLEVLEAQIELECGF